MKIKERDIVMSVAPVKVIRVNEIFDKSIVGENIITGKESTINNSDIDMKITSLKQLKEEYILLTDEQLKELEEYF